MEKIESRIGEYYSDTVTVPSVRLKRTQKEEEEWLKGPHSRLRILLLSYWF